MLAPTIFFALFFLCIFIGVMLTDDVKKHFASFRSRVAISMVFNGGVFFCATVVTYYHSH